MAMVKQSAPRRIEQSVFKQIVEMCYEMNAYDEIDNYIKQQCEYGMQIMTASRLKPFLAKRPHINTKKIIIQMKKYEPYPNDIALAVDCGETSILIGGFNRYDGNMNYITTHRLTTVKIIHSEIIELIHKMKKHYKAYLQKKTC